MQLHVTHTTRYAYDAPVIYGLQKIRLRPVASPMQSVSDWDLTVTGGKIECSYADHHGNQTDLVSITPEGDSVEITARGTINTENTHGVLGKVYGRVPLYLLRMPTLTTHAGPKIQAFAQTLDKHDDLLSGLHALSQAIIEAVPYEAGHTAADTTAEEALSGGKGVCQDHAQIFIAAARLAGLPARYVSGYLMMDDQIDQDASHAWAEVHLDTLGWVGFDVSNGISPDERYIRIAVGRDAKEASPIEGMRMGSAGESMIVSLQVQQ
ncbi:transglutaminase family protein [Pseudosulfitobacter koreensis]|uniref:Transglutaminase family protein n=1 Tax=Pseudosulfitobacter koreensis TaxID=2968472 RepID=A0ABT1YWD1_9RHOB|nr:transglutaminase family protein [Pseudosulfitobacter koreense]MCR8825185.1 transglutaminase family protein [Pseudosulfitobacter koreense]